MNRINKILIAGSTLLSILLPSCLKSDVADYSDWRKKNVAFYEAEEERTEEGVKVYEKIIPVWAPATSILMKWHNDRSLTAKNLIPLDNSTVNVKYILRNYEGTEIQNSFSNTSHGDSIYQTKPCSNITGFWAALTQMHVGDSVTVVIPFSAGYGESSSGSIPPYSTLIYDVALKSIVKYETRSGE